MLSCRINDWALRYEKEVFRADLRRFTPPTGESRKYTSHFWIWRGERIRTTFEFSEDGKIQRSLHEQSEDGAKWRLAMDVTLGKVD